MIQICRHIMPDGARCKSPALKDKPCCYHHDRLHRVLNKPKSSKKNALVLRPLEDRSSVLMALSDVICGLAAGQIDTQKAGRLIYGLQVAGKIATDFAWTVSDKSVKSVDITRTGDELAPVLSYCTPDDHCGSCPSLDDCKLEKSRDWRAAHRAEVENGEEEAAGGGQHSGAEESEEDEAVRKTAA
jgi:hypothetical protein